MLRSFYVIVILRIRFFIYVEEKDKKKKEKGGNEKERDERFYRWHCYIYYTYCYVYRVRKRRKSRIPSRDRIFSILDKRRSSTVLKNEQRRGDYRTKKKERREARRASIEFIALETVREKRDRTLWPACFFREGVICDDKQKKKIK